MLKSKLKYKRVLLKLSGEVLAGDKDAPYDSKVLEALAKDVKKLQKMGCQVGVVLGGGNIWRFRDFSYKNTRAWT